MEYFLFGVTVFAGFLTRKEPQFLWILLIVPATYILSWSAGRNGDLITLFTAESLDALWTWCLAALAGLYVGQIIAEVFMRRWARSRHNMSD